MRGNLWYCEPFDFFAGLAAGFGISGKYIFHVTEFCARRPGQDSLDDLGDTQERQALFKERGHCNFIGSIQGTGQCPALLQSFARQTQTGELDA